MVVASLFCKKVIEQFIRRFFTGKLSEIVGNLYTLFFINNLAYHYAF